MQSRRTILYSEINKAILKTNYGLETVIPPFITGCREKRFSELSVLAKQRKLTRAIHFLTTAGNLKRYHHLRTLIILVPGFIVITCTCWKSNEHWRPTHRISYSQCILKLQTELNITSSEKKEQLKKQKQSLTEYNLNKSRWEYQVIGVPTVANPSHNNTLVSFLFLISCPICWSKQPVLDDWLLA